MDIILEKDKKWQDFLVLIQKKVELQSARENKIDKNTFSLKYKQLTAIFEDKDEIKEYLEYAEKVKKIIRLKHISKQTTRDRKTPDEVFVVETKPSNYLLTGRDFFEAERYRKINYYPEDLFIFEYNKQKKWRVLNKERGEAEIRVKEIRKHFEELNERQKELKESEERIYSRIRKELDVPVHYFKSHEEITKKISEQLAPLKDALERVGRTQQTVKISLTPALQSLAPSLKQLEEQIKNFDELYKAPDHSLSEAIISPDLIRVRQGAEMISELREVRKLIEKSTINKNEPIPIKGELKIEGLKEGLEAIAKTKKEEDKNKFPYKLPAGTVWENIIFQFLNDENVFIKVGQHKHYTNYKEMRLVGKGKNPNPSELWTFLKVLALENGEIPIDNLKRETKYKKQKELLSKFLQSYFGINLDPFYPYKPYPPYKHEKSYKIRMTLIPPPQSAKKQNDLNEEDKDDLGIKEDYKQQTPEIYDKDQ